MQSTVRRGRGVVCVRLRSVYNLLDSRYVWGDGATTDIPGISRVRLHHNNGYRVQSTVRKWRDVVCVGVRSVCNLLSR